MRGSITAKPVLPPLEVMVSYLQYDYGYKNCIEKEVHPEAYELKRLKLLYLQRIALDRAWWVLPLPPRSSVDATPTSTTEIPKDYEVPSFDAEVYEYLAMNAISICLPCRLITLTERDLDDAKALLEQDLETMRGAATPLETPMLKLEGLEVSMAWMVRTVHCMKKLASLQSQKYTPSLDTQEQYIMSLVENGNFNTLEWHAAHVKLEEMQAQEALENWAINALDSVADMEDVSLDELHVRDEPCPSKFNRELTLN